jgi:protein-disulfide isomerase
MVSRFLALAFVVAAVAACSKPAGETAAAPDDPQFHDKVVAYLVDHPGVIQEGINAYNDKQHKALLAQAASAIAPRRQALQDDARDFVANPQGRITVVEFFDYRCPYCKADQAALQSLIASDKDIRFVFKEYPIIPDKDGQVGVSLRAAQAALAAKRAGKYLEVHDALMAAPDLDDATIAGVLRAHGLDPAQASATPEDLRQLADVRQLASAIHVGGTPTFIVGDTLVDSSSMPQLAAAIEKARHQAKG